ncbi:MAG TPA: guanylate kinase [Candidatus Micrarchaeia archaeon]|nr:guanylate kinase [Candidatus Micrarchaeia archaeon]
MSGGGGPAPGRLIVISGPSGVGKDTVIRALRARAPWLHKSVSVTTRAPRPGERQDLDYTFVDRDTFAAMRRQGVFLECAQVHGDDWYGTVRQRVEAMRARGEDVLCKIDVQGAAQLQATLPDAQLIFLLPPSRAALTERLAGRGTEDDAQIRTRERDADRELAEAGRYQFQVVNDQVDRAVSAILAILDQPTAAPPAVPSPVQPCGT